MLLQEIAPTNYILYHATSVKNASQIITSAQFKLSKAADEYYVDPEDMEPRAPEDFVHYHPRYDMDRSMYYLSTARNPSSSSVEMFMTAGYNNPSALLVLNGDRLKNQLNNRAHINPMAYDVGQPGFDEMEDRLVSSKPILPIKGPINDTILAVHVHADLKYLPAVEKITAAVNQFEQLCKSHNIPFYFFKDPKEVITGANHLQSQKRAELIRKAGNSFQKDKQ